MPAPAPWARTNNSQASGGRNRKAETSPMVSLTWIRKSAASVMADAFYPVQRFREIRDHLQYVCQRVSTQLLHPRRHVANAETPDVEIGANLAPLQRT